MPFADDFWQSVLDTAREPLNFIFKEAELPFQEQSWGWMPQRSQPNEGWGWLPQRSSPNNPFIASVASGPQLRNPFRPQQPQPSQQGPLYAGQFQYETALEIPQQQQALVELARQTARAAGIDEDVFVRQIYQESRFDPRAVSRAGAQGLGQLMPATARELGVTNAFDPQQNLQGSARYLKQMLDRYQGDYTKALAAYNAGAGNLDKWGGVPQGEAAIYVNNILAGAKRREAQQGASVVMDPQTGQPTSTKPLRGLTEYQYGSEALATGAADYICGPIAAQAFARFFGRNPTLAESLGMARQLGIIDADKGMYGIESTAKLIKELGGKATVDYDTNPREVLAELMAGRPVIINTPGHYFVIEDYDPRTGKFDFGNSVQALASNRTKRGGNTWYTLEEVGQLGMGAVRGAIYAR